MTHSEEIENKTQELKNAYAELIMRTSSYADLISHAVDKQMFPDHGIVEGVLSDTSTSFLYSVDNFKSKIRELAILKQLI
jgi:hypothetical protein